MHEFSLKLFKLMLSIYSACNSVENNISQSYNEHIPEFRKNLQRRDFKTWKP